MCNKCDTVSTPTTPLLAEWAVTKDNTTQYRNAVINELMKHNHQRENYMYWHHARRGWITDTHPENQKKGKYLAKLKAIANKLATRDVTDILEMECLRPYFDVLDNLDRRTANKLEPAMIKASEATQNGTWELIDVMRTLHPYANGVHADEITLENGSTLTSYDQFARSANAFRSMQFLHFVHISTDDINQIAYYPTLKHMREGREIRTRLGRYLTKYQALFQLTDREVKSMAEKHTSDMRARGGWAVEFVAHDNPQGWVDVYNSPDVSSCMQNEPAVRIYAHELSELRLAYVKAGGKIIARCIVRDDKDSEDSEDGIGYIRVYPDPNGYAEGRYLLDYLKTNGYPKHTNLDGVLLQGIDSDHGGYVCPYLDYGANGSQTVSVEYINGKQYLRAGGGDMQADNTNGYTDNNMYSCDECGDDVDQDDTTYVECTERNVCQHCLQNRYTYAMGRRHHDYYHEDDCVRVDGEWYLKESIAYHDIGWCEYSEEYYKNEDLITTYDGTYHQDYCVAVDHYDDGEYQYVYENRLATLSDGTTCHELDVDKYQAEIDEAIAEEETEEVEA